MTITIKRTSTTEPGATALAITIPAEKVREAEERATREYQSQVKLPGFRKGKAPAAVVKKRFADDIRQHTLDTVVRQSWEQAVEQEALKPIADPHIHDLKWEPETGISFELHVEVRPELKLERLGSFKLTRKVPPVTADQVEGQINQMREQKAPWVPVSGEKPKPKELVHVTIAQREGDTVKEPVPYQLVLGEGRAIPDVEEKIMTLVPGETVDATVRFPDDFPEEAKRGQSREIRLMLQEVKRQQMPELDDAFAREVGDFESLEALRKAVRADLEKEAAREADSRVRSELIDQIVAANNITAPNPLVDRALLVFAQAYGIAEDKFPQFATEFRSIAEAQVRRDLILDYVVDKENLAATEAELDAKIQELAAKRGIPAGQLYATLEKNKRLRDLERGLTEEKVFNHLLSQSTVENA
jgi:trigger factor